MFSWCPVFWCCISHFVVIRVNGGSRFGPDTRFGPGSVVGIATGYRLDGPGIESWWGRDFPHLSTPALGPTQAPVQWVQGLSQGVKRGRGMTLTPSPTSSAVDMKEWSYTSTPSMGHMACTEPQCLYKGAHMFLGVRCSHLHPYPYLNAYVSGHSNLSLTDECGYCT